MWLVGAAALTVGTLVYIATLSPAATLRPRMSPGGPTWLWPLFGKGRLPCERFGYSSSFLYDEFENYGSVGRELYRSYLRTDFAFPLFYAPALAISLALLGSAVLGVPPERAWFANAPLVAGAADWCENGLLLFTVTRYSRSIRHDGLVRAASGMTTLKLALIYGSLGAVTFGAVADLVKRWVV